MVYTIIPDSAVDQDSAITQPLMTALRDNISESFVNYQVFIDNGNWIKPTNLPATAMVTVQMWGGGGSGQRGTSPNPDGCGGGGGGFNEFTVLASTLGATEAVVVGAGGAATTGTGQGGNAGGFSQFSIGKVFGGSKGSDQIGGSVLGLFGSSATNFFPGTDGGACGSANSSINTVGAYFGGGGGKSSNNSGSATSVFGGAGGNAFTAGTAPGGGGGGATFSGGNSGAGARGEVRIFTTW